VWGDDSFVRGLGQRAGLPCGAAGADAHGWLERGARQDHDHHLVVLDPLVLPARHGDLGAWRTQLEKLERDWFAPLLDALRRRRVARLDIVALGAECSAHFTLTRRGLLRFWRARTSLAGYAGDPPR